MKITFGKNKLKAAAVFLCAVITAGSFTYVNHGDDKVKTVARTVSEIEAEKADNQADIDALQKKIDDLKGDLADQKEYQKQLQEKIDLQNDNIDNINAIINDLNNKIAEKEEKITQLEKDIAAKQEDIEEGLELFKARLRAMYISGNDSLASALVGSTDFYDMLSKIELISQVAKHDDELIDSLKTQLEQFQEAQAQLDIEKTALDADRKTQEESRIELSEYRDQLQADYEESEDYISRKNADLASQQRDIESLEADNAAMDDEIAEINAAIQSSYSSSSSSYYDDDDDDYSGGGSGDGEMAASSGSGSYSGGALSWPVPGFYGISSGYGYRWGSFHRGIDIAGGGIAGATVTAAGSGTVIVVKTGCSHNYGKDGSCGCNGGYGNYVVIDHGNGITTTYGHCDSVYVSVGQSVSSGQAIATVGSTGWSTGFHCHFEVQVNGSSVDPTSYV